MSSIVLAFHRWRRGITPAFATSSLRTFGLLPLLWNRAIGAVIGRTIWWHNGRSVDVSSQNISRAYPQLSAEQQRELTRNSVIETAKTAVEVASIWSQPYSRLSRFILAVDNIELLKPNNQAAKNTVVLLPHLGNWELLSTFLPQHIDITFIYQPSGIESMDALIRDGRAREGLKLAPSNRQGVAKVLQALRDGECVGILPDQVPERSSGGKIVEFFNHPALTMTLVYKLIQRTQCRVVVSFVERVSKGFKIHFCEPDPRIYSADESESLAGLNRSVENCVRQIPEQYQWEYKRFKRVPVVKENA